jgi:hypothetical protein
MPRISEFYGIVIEMYSATTHREPASGHRLVRRTVRR